MPITVTAPRGTLTETGAREVLPQLTAALLDATGGTGNRFFTQIVGGTVQQLPPGDVYAGGVNRPIVLVELKLPNIALASIETRTDFITRATAIVARCTTPDHDDENTWVNVLHASDGAWGIGGRNYTNAAIVEAADAAVSSA